MNSSNINDNINKLFILPGASKPKSITLRSPGVAFNYTFSRHSKPLQSCLTPEKQNPISETATFLLKFVLNSQHKIIIKGDSFNNTPIFA